MIRNNFRSPDQHILTRRYDRNNLANELGASDLTDKAEKIDHLFKLHHRRGYIRRTSIGRSKWQVICWHSQGGGAMVNDGGESVNYLWQRKIS